MKKIFYIFLFSLSILLSQNVYADTYTGDFKGWFDSNKSYSVSGQSAKFSSLIDNNLDSSCLFTFTTTVTFTKPLYFESLMIKSSSSSSSDVEVTYTDMSVSKLYFNDGSHIFALDTTKQVKSVSFKNYSTFYEFDMIAVTNFYLNAFSPSNGRVDVSLDDTLRCVFNNDIATVGKIVLSDSNGNLVNGKLVHSGSACEFIPLEPLRYGTKYDVSIYGFVDGDGSEMKVFNSSFTTIKDTIPISVIDIKPPPDSVDVPVDTNIEIKFNKKNIDTSSFDDVYIDGVKTTKQFINGILFLTIREPLEYEKEYFIHIDGVKDTLGNGMTSPVDVKFSTMRDTTGLVLKSYKPPSGIYPLNTQLEFNFNKNVDSRTLKYTIVDGDGNDVSCSVNVVGTKVTFSPILLNSKKYTFTFLEIKDFNENVYNSPITINFETMTSSGQKDFDGITSGILEFIGFIKEHGLIIVLAAILLGIIFIISRWLWKKLKIWLATSGK